MSDLPLVRFVMAIGETRFAQCALDFVNTQIAVDHISLFMLDHELVPHFLDAASRAGLPTARLAGGLYERANFYRHDANAEQVSRRPGEEDVMIFRENTADFRDPPYRDRLYRRFNLLERLSVVRAVNGRWFAFNLYRDVKSGPFDANDTDVLSGLAALLITCTAKHVALAAAARDTEPRVQSRDYLEALLESLELRLTRREREVCSLTLLGQTVDGIADTLGIQQSTVATLRRRAYAKLRIKNLNGLFALCIAKVSRRASTRP